MAKCPRGGGRRITPELTTDQEPKWVVPKMSAFPKARGHCGLKSQGKALCEDWQKSGRKTS